MDLVTWKCTKCGAVQQLPDTIEEEEPCMLCGGRTERQD